MAIDLNTIKKMSPQAKLLAVVLIFFLVGYLYWFYFLSSAMEKKSNLSTKLAEMQEKIKEKEKVAMQLNKYMADDFLAGIAGEIRKIRCSSWKWSCLPR